LVGNILEGIACGYSDLFKIAETGCNVELAHIYYFSADEFFVFIVL